MFKSTVGTDINPFYVISYVDDRERIVSQIVQPSDHTAMEQPADDVTTKDAWNAAC